MAETPTLSPGGTVRIADMRNFVISSDIAAALVEVQPGYIRKIHWHPSADEWQFYIAGKARMTVFGAQTNSRNFDFQAGDVGTVPCFVERVPGAGSRSENAVDRPLYNCCQKSK